MSLLLVMILGFIAIWTIAYVIYLLDDLWEVINVAIMGNNHTPGMGTMILLMLLAVIVYIFTVIYLKNEDKIIKKYNVSKKYISVATVLVWVIGNSFISVLDYMSAEALEDLGVLVYSIILSVPSLLIYIIGKIIIAFKSRKK